MKNNSANSIRSAFTEYFVKNGHEYVTSSPLVPHNDPTLMFTNAGMVQFKNVFTGLEKLPYSTATTSQKCVRAGGKHNDLENVGYTARHHTFFEMLGNFSFGDYFKEKAIYYAWDLLTKHMELPKEKLYVTVYHTDEEAIDHWKKISGFGDDKIIRIKTNDNFWSMGPVGPCGPCSEIFYDHGPEIAGGLPGTPEEDGDRFIEIWNMVFMQYEQIDENTRIDLPKPSIDTGMGLERIAAVLQGVHNNYEIDMFRDIISASEEFTKSKAAGDALFSHRVIADHLRSCSFLISDGVMPSNEGRGYVLRRIMRRAMRHAHILGADEPVMYKMLPTLVSIMGDAFPDLKRSQDFVSGILKQEEERFKKTLDRGLKLLEEETSSISKGGTLPGEVAFKLYDTYGFPADLTEDILKSKNISVDHKGFENSMNEQKERARKSWSGSGEAATNKVWFEVEEKSGATEFVGYTLDEAQGQITSLIDGDKLVDKIDAKDNKFTLIANQTPFYGESGGQMGDRGYIISDNAKIRVLDTKKHLGKIHSHICKLEEGSVSEGDTITLKIDTGYRRELRYNHSATHILHAVLRETLGSHVTQKGSLVASDRLRFDISHPNALTKEEITIIEDKVNRIIRENTEVSTVLMSTEDAIEKGAMALFGEKYDSEVRVVSMAGPYSIELCGGTHVSRTGDIGSFKIISENAIAAGIRRIEAVTGRYVTEYQRESDELINNLAESLKAGKSEISEKVISLMEGKKALEKELKALKMSGIGYDKARIEKEAIPVKDGLSLIYQYVDDADPKILREVAENTSKLDDKLIVVFTSKSGPKGSLIIATSKEVTLKASDLIKVFAEYAGLKGGGGSDKLAQAGGPLHSGFGGFEDKVKSHLV